VAGPGAPATEGRLLEFLGPERLDGLDLFDRIQLSRVIEVCERSRSLSDAGRALYSASRGKKTTVNDADRVRKYLARFGIEWAKIPRER
jgi:transcriptional regulatory protein RtcR